MGHFQLCSLGSSPTSHLLYEHEYLLVSKRVKVTQSLLDRVGGYYGLCKMLMQNKSLREVEWVFGESYDWRIFCNFLKASRTIMVIHILKVNIYCLMSNTSSVIHIKNDIIAGSVDKISDFQRVGPSVDPSFTNILALIL